MLEVLRLSHRIKRDKRISTHVALVARAFGASKLYYTGQKDSSMETSVNSITKEWGSNFKIEHIKEINQFFKKPTVNLTMYGLPLKEKIDEIRKLKDITVIVGSEKVPIEIYKKSTYNISIFSQPHSEVSALAIFLYEYFNKKEPEFKNSKKIIIPTQNSKKLKTFKY